MSIVESIMLAVSLCADCFAVSLCSSVTLRKAEWKSILATALAFAVIQTGLLAAGWLVGNVFYGLVETISNIIGFLLLAYVGGSMIVEGVKGCDGCRNLNGWKNIILGGIATSIDAAAVGVSQSMGGGSAASDVALFLAVFVCTAVSVIAGISAGKTIGSLKGRNVGRIAETAGGIVLVGIGFSFLF